MQLIKTRFSNIELFNIDYVSEIFILILFVIKANVIVTTNFKGVEKVWWLLWSNKLLQGDI